MQERQFLRHQLFKKLNGLLIRVRVVVFYCHLVTRKAHFNKKF